MESIKTIAVIGAGTMGQGIAQLCAVSGFPVMLYDVQSALTRSALSSIQKNLEAACEKGKIDSETKDNAINRITAVDDFRLLQVDLAIEAVVEKLEVKQKILTELEKINGKTCILATNTSSIPITQIASGLRYPDRFAGLHFFNPAPVMKLVEIIKGAATSDATIDIVKQFTARISREAVMAHDSPGFIVNRVARHFYVESLKILEEGVSDFETIDTLMKASGFKMGPFELMDLIGMDTNFAVTMSIYNAFHQHPKFRPSRIQQQKVEAGQLGRKTGRGFYEY